MENPKLDMTEYTLKYPQAKDEFLRKMKNNILKLMKFKIQ